MVSRAAAAGLSEIKHTLKLADESLVDDNILSVDGLVVTPHGVVFLLGVVGGGHGGRGRKRQTRVHASFIDRDMNASET